VRPSRGALAAGCDMPGLAGRRPRRAALYMCARRVQRSWLPLRVVAGGSNPRKHRAGEGGEGGTQKPLVSALLLRSTEVAVSCDGSEVCRLETKKNTVC